MNVYTVKEYAMAIRLGSKYTYQTIPRILTLWLDMGEDAGLHDSETFTLINNELWSAVKQVPTFKVSP